MFLTMDTGCITVLNAVCYTMYCHHEEMCSLWVALPQAVWKFREDFERFRSEVVVFEMAF